MRSVGEIFEDEVEEFFGKKAERRLKKIQNAELEAIEETKRNSYQSLIGQSQFVSDRISFFCSKAK
jgi:hypothetical protein